MESLPRLDHILASGSYDSSLEENIIHALNPTDLNPENKEEEEIKIIQDSISVEGCNFLPRVAPPNNPEENKNTEMITRLSISENSIPQMSSSWEGNSSSSNTQNGLANLQLNLIMGDNNNIDLNQSSSSSDTSELPYFEELRKRNYEIQAEP